MGPQGRPAAQKGTDCIIIFLAAEKNSQPAENHTQEADENPAQVTKESKSENEREWQFQQEQHILLMLGIQQICELKRSFDFLKMLIIVQNRSEKVVFVLVFSTRNEPCGQK